MRFSECTLDELLGLSYEGKWNVVCDLRAKEIVSRSEKASRKACFF